MGKSAPSDEATLGIAESRHLLDPTVLETYCRGDEGLICDILEEFVPAQRASVNALLRAVAEGDRAEVRTRAHRVKSAALMVGGTRLADVARTVEIAAEQGSDDRAADAAEAVGHVMDLTERAVTAVVEGLDRRRRRDGP